MKKLRLISVLASIVFLFGCASGAKMESMVVTVDPGSNMANYEEALKNEISVTSVKGGRKTTSVTGPEISNEDFLGALKNSLSKHGLLASEKGKYNLNARLVRVDKPAFGVDMTVTTHIKYMLTNMDNDVLYNKTIIAPYTATMGDAFAGAKRLRLANEGAGRENIKKLLADFEKLKIELNAVSISD